MRNLDLSCFNGAIWDFKNGVILRLGEGAQVTHAVHGFNSLSGYEIKNLYGDGIPEFHNWKNKEASVSEDFEAIFGSFNSCKIPVICHIVDLIKTKRIDKTFEEFYFDLRECTQFNSDSGYLYKALKQNP